MSKKLASGADVICLDVKIGDGAFMKTIEDARELSRIMVSIGNSFGKKVTAFITNMDQPLGMAVGNRLEVKEVVDTLNGKGPDDLVDLCVQIASYMMLYSNKADDLESAKRLVEEQINNGEAYAKFLEFIKAQGALDVDFDNFISVEEVLPYKAKKTGYIKQIKALNIGLASMKLGGGRETKDDDIDPNVGIILKKKVGDFVNIGDELLDIYRNKALPNDIFDLLDEAYVIVEERIERPDTIQEIIG
jgi:pyrimidine-nucleoside phosphorylase